jgi:drug/metabolite transporter (DMT)-like permease
LGQELAAVFFGLAAAASWGAGDFGGGVATKRSPVYLVVLLSHIVGLAGLFLLIGLSGELLPASGNLWIGALGGIAGAVGVAALYTGLSQGRMGIVAPLTAVITAIVPVLFGLFSEGLPTTQQLVGFLVALLSVWLISSDNGMGFARLDWQDFRLPIIAGLGFGLFFISIDQVSDDAILWPLAAARVASIIFMLILVLISRQRGVPAKGQLAVIAMVGVSDTVGNVFFALATSLGRLDIAAILSSLYPAVTILLAHLLLDENISRQQWIGIAAALAAVVLITA